MPELADVLTLVLLVGCFTVLVLYARLCDHVLGSTGSSDSDLPS